MKSIAFIGLVFVACASSPPTERCPQYVQVPEIVDPFEAAPERVPVIIEVAPPSADDEDGGVDSECGMRCVPFVQADGGISELFSRVF